MNPHRLIIGGTRGVGRELVQIFSGLGDKVSVIGRNAPSEKDRTLKGVSFWSVDLLNKAALSTTLAEIVRNNGPINSLVFLQRYKGDGDKWIGEFETTLSATKEVIESLAGQFSEAGDKSIVVVSSIADQFVAEGQPVGYHVCKAGLYHMICYFAVTLGRKGIRVNCVSPSTFVKEESRKFYEGNNELQRLFAQVIPLGRIGNAVDSANAIAFLCSPKASFITGQRITVDGGVSLLSQEALARALAGV
jgi:NAD(P)-dependent dehydrogenase (short-subunit alcohol dehydrogenase family)